MTSPRGGPALDPALDPARDPSCDRARDRARRQRSRRCIDSSPPAATGTAVRRVGPPRRARSPGASEPGRLPDRTASTTTARLAPGHVSIKRNVRPSNPSTSSSGDGPSPPASPVPPRRSRIVGPDGSGSASPLQAVPQDAARSATPPRSFTKYSSRGRRSRLIASGGTVGRGSPSARHSTRTSAR